MQHPVPTMFSQHGGGADDGDTLDMEAVARFVKWNWRRCLIWLGAGLGVGLAFMALSPSYYTARTVVLFDDFGRATATGNGAGEAAVSAYVDSQVQVLQSDEVIGRVVDKARLVQDSEFGTSSATVTPAARHVTITRAAAALSVRRLGASNAVEITFTSRDREQAAALANAILRNYIDGRLEASRKAAADAASDLRDRLAQVRDKAFAPEMPQPDSAADRQQSGEAARARFRELQDNTATYRALYNTLLQRANTAADQDGFSLGARVITPAEPPLRRSWPRLMVVAAIVSGAGIAGIGHALAREMADKSLRSPDDLRRLTGFDQIASIPARVAGRPASSGDGTAGLQPAYIEASDELRGPIERLASRLRGGRAGPSAIGIIGVNDGAGASSIAAHLAQTLAEGGRRTLLIDANWRKEAPDLIMEQPSLGLALARGRSRIRAGAGSFDLLVLRQTSPLSPLHASRSIGAVLETVRDEYECVVVDFHTPTQTADWEAALPAIDESVVVVEAGRTTANSVQGLLRLLPAEKPAVLIMNKTVAGPADLRTELSRLLVLVAGCARRAATALSGGIGRLAVSPPATSRSGAWPGRAGRR